LAYGGGFVLKASKIGSVETMYLARGEEQGVLECNKRMVSTSIFVDGEHGRESYRELGVKLDSPMK